MLEAIKNLLVIVAFLSLIAMVVVIPLYSAAWLYPRRWAIYTATGLVDITFTLLAVLLTAVMGANRLPWELYPLVLPLPLAVVVWFHGTYLFWFVKLTGRHRLRNFLSSGSFED